MKIINYRDISIYDDYITNIDEILNLIESKYSDRFLDRKMKESTSAAEDINGGDILIVGMETSLYKTIFKTIDRTVTPTYPDEVDIYRYNYGNYLPRHKDAAVTSSMMTDLIFLKSETNHFKIYTEEYPQGHFVAEIPGRRIIIAPDLEHEITPMNLNESTRYTLVMTWYNDKDSNSLWKKR